MTERFPQLRIAVLGDFFLDRYLLVDSGKEEKTPETGLIAYQVIGRRQSPGADGAVLRILKTLGIGEVVALGMTGLDGEGFELREELRKIRVNIEHLLVVPERITPCMIRPMRLGREEETEMNRLNVKNQKSCPSWVVDYLAKTVEKLADSLDAIMVLDQLADPETGVVTNFMREELARISRKKHKEKLFAVSKSKIADFSNFIVKCNHRDLVGQFYPEFDLANNPGAEPPEELVIECAKRIGEQMRKPLFVTLGERGCYVVENGMPTLVPAFKVDGPIDHYGAGNAAFSGIVAAMTAGENPLEAARIGNAAAAIAIQQPGSSGTITPEYLMAILREDQDDIPAHNEAK